MPDDAVLPDPRQGRWSIHNQGVACEIQLTAGQARWRMRDLRSGHAIGPSALGEILIAGQPVAWSADVEVRADEGADGTHALQITQQSTDGSLRLTRLLEIFPEASFVRLSGALENVGAAATLVTGCEIVNLELPGRQPLVLFHVEQFSWAYRRDFFSQNQALLAAGRTPVEIRMGSFPSHYAAPSSCAWIALRDGAADQPGLAPNEGVGLVAGIEFNGKSRLRAWASPEQTQLCSTIDELQHVLAPGASFEIPAWFVGGFSGDWDAAGYETQRFAERYVHPPMPDERYPWVQYNSWRYEQAIDAQQQLAAIERCAELGVEVVVLDLGWARQIGEWRHDPAKFPDGLRPLSDRAHALGMRFGLHLPLAQANPDAPVAREHPDWLIHTGDDYFGAGPLCLGHQPCREWLVDAIVRLIDDYGVDYFVQDGEDMVKRCPQTSHTHAPGDSNYSNSTLGLDQVIGTVRRLRPQVVWENCEDGGCMLTYRMARLYHSSITVDNIATYATRQGIYGASYAFSPRYSVRYMQDDPTPYTLRSAIFGGPLILMHRVTEWSPAQIAETQAAIAQYKELRQIVRDARIIHLLPPRYNVAGQGWGWDAIQAVAPDGTRSVVMVYRALGDTARATIRPRGLAAARTYRVALHDSGAVYELTGAALARDGITVELPELASEIIRIEAQ